MNEWEITYGAYTVEELDAEITWLKEQSRNLYGSQQEGQRGYTRNTQDIRIRLAAATKVRAEASGGAEWRGEADFSGVQP